MTDLIGIAVMRRKALWAEVESLDRFIETAEWLVQGQAGKPRAGLSASTSPASGRGAPRESTAPVAKVTQTATDATRASGSDRQGGDQRRAATADPALAAEWSVDTFHFEAAATAS